jgi:hypothetical protein
MEEDVYFITGLSRRGEDFPQFPELPHGVAGETQLAYVQRYVHLEVHSSLEFQVHGGQLWIVHLVERRLGACVLFSRHCHNIALMGTH